MVEECGWKRRRGVDGWIALTLLLMSCLDGCDEERKKWQKRRRRRFKSARGGVC
jgi:hypothetical protein